MRHFEATSDQSQQTNLHNDSNQSQLSTPTLANSESGDPADLQSRYAMLKLSLLSAYVCIRQTARLLDSTRCDADNFIQHDYPDKPD
jgi:hypothetical protein